MKRLLFLAVAIQIASNVSGLPLPAGQIVNYRVPSKYFSKANETAPESNDSLYNFLSQIHYGGSLHTVTINLEDIQLEDVSKKGLAVVKEESAVEVTTSEAPEATTIADVPELPTEQQMDEIKVNDNSEAHPTLSGFHALFEKVVKQELEKLSHLTKSPIDVITESTTATTTATAADDDVVTTPEENSAEEDESAKTTTMPPTQDESTISNRDVSDSLLSAVGDLLSSILGLNGDTARIEESDDAEGVTSDNGDEKFAVTEETTEAEPLVSTETSEIERNTQQIDGTSTPEASADEQSEKDAVTSGDAAANAHHEEKVNEIDLKIENLANAQTSFVTEGSPEQVTETVRDDSAADVLEAITSEAKKQDSIDDRINQVMDLVKDTEGRIELQSMGNVVDSVLVDKHIKEDMSDLDQIVYGTLKEIETNLGILQDNPVMLEAVQPMVQSQENLMRNYQKLFEEEIRESVMNKKPFEDRLDFVPNSAKAALHYSHPDFVEY